MVLPTLMSMSHDYKPRYGNWISAGNVLTIIFGVITATGMFFVMDARSQTNAGDISEIKVDITQLQRDMRKLETDQARSDERYGSILGILERIDTRLERIEASK